MTLRSAVAFFVVVLAFTVAGFSQTSPSKEFGVHISNFGKMDARFYRGGRPSGKDFAELKALGINTIIDLTDNSKHEKADAEAAGLRYVNIAIPDKSYPTEQAAADFLKTVDDPATGVFYVHCAGGRHRTGDMGALYRLAKYNWTYDQAYQEMLNYDFYTSNGHQKAKDYVVDLFAKASAAKSTVAKNTTAVTASK